MKQDVEATLAALIMMGDGGEEPPVAYDLRAEENNKQYLPADYNADYFSSVYTDIKFNVGEKTITQNGTYSASDDELDGYDVVYVNCIKEVLYDIMTTPAGQPIGTPHTLPDGSIINGVDIDNIGSFLQTQSGTAGNNITIVDVANGIQFEPVVDLKYNDAYPDLGNGLYGTVYVKVTNLNTGYSVTVSPWQNDGKAYSLQSWWMTDVVPRPEQGTIAFSINRSGYYNWDRGQLNTQYLLSTVDAMSFPVSQPMQWVCTEYNARSFDDKTIPT